MQEQLQKYFAIDKSDQYGIATNLHIIIQYIKNLYQFVTGNLPFNYLLYSEGSGRISRKSF